jgi:hypothetical protein
MRAAGGNGRHHMKCKATHMLATGSGETQDHGGEASQWVEFSEVDISDFEKPNPKTLKRRRIRGWKQVEEVEIGRSKLLDEPIEMLDKDWSSMATDRASKEAKKSMKKG